MKRLTHKPRIPFATNFSWWFGRPEGGLAAGFSRTSQASRSPAKAGSRDKILATRPPTEVGGKQDSCDALSVASCKILYHSWSRR